MSLEWTKMCTGGNSSSESSSESDPDGKTTTADAGAGASSAIGGKRGVSGLLTMVTDLQ